MPEKIAPKHDVQAAEVEAIQAAAGVAELEKRLVSGDDTVTIEHIETQERLSRFAKLRLEQTRGKAERARAAARLAEAQAIRDEIEKDALKTGKDFVAKLRAIHEAESAFSAAAEAHNGRIADWKQRMHRLDIPETNGSPIPPAKDGNLALSSSTGRIHAGRRVLDVVPSQQIIEALRTNSDPELVYTHLDGLLSEKPEATAAHFYRNALGTVMALDTAYGPEDMARLELTEISRGEAWGE